jgi:uncharacterized protein (TIGR03437 family)
MPFQFSLSTVFLSLTCANFLSAQTLVTPGAIARPGETIAASISFSSDGQAVSGLQFDIECDPVLSIHIAPGAQIADSSKLFFQGTPRPGVLRLLIVGMNQRALSDGELIRLFITVAPDSPPFVPQIVLTNALGTTPESAPASLVTGPINIQIQSGAPAQIVPPTGLLNAASLLPGAISPGELVTLFGSLTAVNPILLFNGRTAPILYAGANQINAIVPYGLEREGTATLEIVQSSSRGRLILPIAPATPAIFTFSSGGAGQGAILNQDYSQNSESSPARPGSLVMVFGTGFGGLDPTPLDGETAASPAATVSPVSAVIDGVPAEVTYAGAAPGLIFGLVQIDVRVPEDLAANSQASLSLSIAGQSTQPGVTVSIR